MRFKRRTKQNRKKGVNTEQERTKEKKVNTAYIKNKQTYKLLYLTAFVLQKWIVAKVHDYVSFFHVQGVS